MDAKKNIIQTLHTIKIQLKARFKVKDIWLFGSFVRGEQNKKSDVDILVDFSDGATLFDWVGLGLYLEKKLGRKVDIVTKKSLRREWKSSILREMVRV